MIPHYLRISANVSNQMYAITNVKAFVVESNINNIAYLESFVSDRIADGSSGILTLKDPYTGNVSTQSPGEHLELIGYAQKAYSNINSDYQLRSIEPNVEYFTYLYFDDNGPSYPYVLKTDETDLIPKLVEITQVNKVDTTIVCQFNALFDVDMLFFVTNVPDITVSDLKTHGTFETFQPGSHQRVVETFQNNFLETADINASPRVYAYVLIKKDHEQFLERFEFVN